MTRRIPLLIAAAALLLAACSDSDSGSSATATTAAAAPAAADGAAQATHSDIAITRVDFDADSVTVTNLSSGPVSLDDIWLCQRPTYSELGGVLEAGASMEFGGIGGLNADSGEAGLYIGRSFDSSDAIVSYVEWGESGHGRSSTASDGGVWPGGDFVDAGDAPAIDATVDRPASAADWTVG